MKSVLVTGGAGFIGSCFIKQLLQQDSDFKLINLDALTYAANLDLLASCTTDSRYNFVHGTICDELLVNELFNTHQFDAVFHFAAESHVDNSIATPKIFFETNIMGTFNLVQAAKECWMDAPFNVKDAFKHARFHHVSTDEVYGSLGDNGFFVEDMPYAPNSPYSASKASSDFILRSYHHTYGLNMTISNCSNNYGPGQHSEKLIPTIVRNAVSSKPIPIYGDGKNVRDWLYVADHCDAILRIFEKGISGETYNVGTRNELTNLDLCHHICGVLDTLKPREDKKSYAEQITFVKDRPGHDHRYAIDSSKLEQTLGWKANATFQEHLKETLISYLT